MSALLNPAKPRFSRFIYYFSYFRVQLKHWQLQSAGNADIDSSFLTVGAPSSGYRAKGIPSPRAEHSARAFNNHAGELNFELSFDLLGYLRNYYPNYSVTS